jgi:hypothetical protein
MDFESYLRVLLSVWVGLGLGQLVQALHRLARFKGTIKWDWLPVIWATLAFLMFVQTWWAYFTILQVQIWTNLFAFLLPLAVFVILYLICASALPDAARTPEGAAIDLRTFYMEQHKYFFALWALLLGLAVVVSMVSRDGLHLRGGDGFRAAGLLAALLLMRSPTRQIHAIVTVISVTALVVYILLFTLRLA